jgi:hypothetical protein
MPQEVRPLPLDLPKPQRYSITIRTSSSYFNHCRLIPFSGKNETKATPNDTGKAPYPSTSEAKRRGCFTRWSCHGHRGFGKQGVREDISVRGACLSGLTERLSAGGIRSIGKLTPALLFRTSRFLRRVPPALHSRFWERLCYVDVGSKALSCHSRSTAGQDQTKAFGRLLSGFWLSFAC